MDTSQTHPPANLAPTYLPKLSTTLLSACCPAGILRISGMHRLALGQFSYHHYYSSYHSCNATFISVIS